MKTMLLKKMVLLLSIFLMSCSLSEMDKQSLQENNEVIVQEQIDLGAYTALTNEAQNAIDHILLDDTSSQIINGGVTDEMIKNNIKNNDQLDAITRSAGQPSYKPYNASTRPKIYWVGKKYGPSEAYILNMDIHDFNKKEISPYSITYKKTTIWEGSSGNILYCTAILQKTSFLSHVVRYLNYGSNNFHNNVLALDQYYYLDSRKTNILYELNTDTNDYIYSFVPSYTFEKSSQYPIQQTWYANPKRHFEKINMIKINGRIYYGASTKPGAETQKMIYRWYTNDFKAAYFGKDGWHAQGWYIKDLDAENGVIAAILYKPKKAYDEAVLFHVTESRFWDLMKNSYWPRKYRGLIIDTSW